LKKTQNPKPDYPATSNKWWYLW